MGTYCYTLSRSTRNVRIDGEVRALPYFKYAFNDSVSGNEAAHASSLASADRAYAHHRDPAGFVLALDGDVVVKTRVDNYLDVYSPEEIHLEIIGKVERRSGRLWCVTEKSLT